MLKKKKALRALDSFQALYANTVKPTSSPPSTGTRLLRQPRAYHSSQSSGWTKPRPSQRHSKDFICRGSQEQPGKDLEPEAPSTSPAAPSSILFILQQGVLVRESKLPLFLRAQLPSSPSSENCSSHRRGSHQEKPVGRPNRTRLPGSGQSSSSPRLTWARLSSRTPSSSFWFSKTTSFRSCNSAQAAMALST